MTINTFLNKVASIAVIRSVTTDDEGFILGTGQLLCHVNDHLDMFRIFTNFDPLPQPPYDESLS